MLPAHDYFLKISYLRQRDNPENIPWKSLALEPHFLGKAWQNSLEAADDA